MKKKTYFESLLIFTTLLIFIVRNVHSQPGNNPELLKTVTQQVIPTSPEAASIMLYQTYPIDYVSGAPQISIPLLTIKTGMGDIPFSLDYQIGKVKPSQLSGIVGTGWTLSPNLGITRAVHGLEDKINSGFPANNQFGSTNSGYLFSAAKGGLDEQPDDYFYSLLNKAGSFVYKRNYGFVPLAYQPVIIGHPDDDSFEITDDDGTTYIFGKYTTGSNPILEYTYENDFSNKNVTSWKITEIISYNKSDTIRFHYNSSYNTQMIPYFNAQWKVVEFSMAALDLTNRKETEVYQARAEIQEPPILEGRAGYMVLKPDIPHTGDFWLNKFDLMLNGIPLLNEYKMTPNNTTLSSGTINQKAIWNAIGDLGTGYSDESILKLNYIRQVLLDSVTYRGGKVVFSYDLNHQLAFLYAYSGDKLIRNIKFVQHRTPTDYFERNLKPPFITHDLYNHYCKRYFLDSIIIRGKDTIFPGLRYGLNYTSDELGVYSNYNTDYWDYLKYGVFDNNVPRVRLKVDNYIWYTGSLTSDPNDPNIGARHHTPLWLPLGNLQERTTPSSPIPGGIGLLSAISYPGGGSARFEFEENRYESFSESAQIVYGGGYRIKSIHYITPQGQDSIIKNMPTEPMRETDTE